MRWSSLCGNPAAGTTAPHTSAPAPVRFNAHTDPPRPPQTPAASFKRLYREGPGVAASALTRALGRRVTLDTVLPLIAFRPSGLIPVALSCDHAPVSALWR